MMTGREGCTGRKAITNERGVTYLYLMFAIVMIGIATSAAAKQWKVMMQRELEADLILKGIEIQNALTSYSTAMKAGRVVPGEVYPQSLAELTRLPKPYLRKVYLDPMTHSEWEYLRGPAGGIMGVRSRSKAEPFRKHDFPLAVRHFDGRKSYHDWVFQHPNPSSGGGALVPTVPVQQGNGTMPQAGTPSQSPVSSSTSGAPSSGGASSLSLSQ